ncbi:MAG: hypothetical protein H0W86_11675 [Armatimonadetes bacterium]|nr:hypothetical protein [Armatimonadota bacterium]
MYTIADYDFDGPYTQLYEIVDQRGVFVVLSDSGGEWRVLDVDCAEYVRSAIERHPRIQKWKDACYHGGLSYAVYYSGVRSDAEME